MSTHERRQQPASIAAAVGTIAWLIVVGCLVLLVASISREAESSSASCLAGVAALGASCVAGVAYAALYQGQRRMRLEVAEMNRIAERALEMLGASARAETDRGSDASSLRERLQALLARLGPMLEEHHQREREVLRADQLALVGQMAAGVAHEIRNPLTSIKLLVQSGQKEGAASDLSDDDLRIIEQEIRRMERSLQRFLDFARPPRPEQRPLDLVALVEQTLALIEGRARKQQVDVELDAPGRPLLVNADQDQLQQLVLNLVINALDVMAEGGRLLIWLRQTAREVELRVEDTGPGISAELMPRLFDPFVSTKETGVGLGLAVSYRIAERHAGRLWAEPDRPAGAGACLCLVLPALEVSSIT
ncbi:MAG: hypothetical protein KF708_24130 [Pirellulales bacterium]|nr:hypothetical protein [Pirellulales bacterium]